MGGVRGAGQAILREPVRGPTRRRNLPVYGPKGRLLSMCGDAAKGRVQYRFGRPGQIEMAFPERPQDAPSQLLYSHYFRAQTDRTEVRCRERRGRLRPLRLRGRRAPRGRRAGHDGHRKGGGDCVQRSGREPAVRAEERTSLRHPECPQPRPMPMTPSSGRSGCIGAKPAHGFDDFGRLSGGRVYPSIRAAITVGR